MIIQTLNTVLVRPLVTVLDEFLGAPDDLVMLRRTDFIGDRPTCSTAGKEVS